MLRTPVPLNPEVTGVLIEAATSARGKELHDAHYLAALLRVGAVERALRDVGVDVDALRARIAEVVERLPKRPWYRLALHVSGPVQRAAEVAARTGQRELSSLFLFATLAHEPSPEIAAALAGAGFSLLHFRWRVAHGDAPREERCPGEGPVRVVLHDDPFTTVAFVHDALREELGRDHETAVAITARVSPGGHVELATMDASDVTPRIERIRARAEALRFPLRIRAVGAKPEGAPAAAG